MKVREAERRRRSNALEEHPQTSGEQRSAYSPDPSGCAATGSTREEAEKRVREALALCFEGLCADGPLDLSA
jgi:hypothetical protein